MTLEEAFRKFIYALDGEVQEKTLTWYQSHLSTLVATLGSRDIDTIDTDDLRAWRYQQFHHQTRYDHHPAHPQAQGEISIYTKRGRVRALKRFFSWLHNEGHIGNNPARRMKAPPKPRNREPKAISEDDISKLYTVARHPRDSALLHVLDESGARVGGIVTLTLNDISKDCRTLKVTEKGDKSRLVYLTEDGADALCAWINIRPITDNDALFTSLRQHTPLTAGGIYLILKRLARAAGVQRFNPHSFRHAFAHGMLDEGASLDIVSDMLGHSSITVTAENYAIWTKAELKTKHNELSQKRKAHRDKLD